MLGNLLTLINGTPEQKMRHQQVAKMLAGMGGSIDKLGFFEKRKLVKLVWRAAERQKLPIDEQMRKFFENMDEERDQLKLMRKSGVFDQGDQDSKQTQEKIRQLYRTGFAVPPSLQALLNEIPAPELRDHITENLREALHFRPVMPPRKNPGLTFLAGCQWPPKGWSGHV